MLELVASDISFYKSEPMFFSRS